jgi:hypothetical protein
MDAKSLGLLIVVAGAALVAVGLLVASGAFGWLSWFGRLPGDLRIEGESTRVYVPITSMILVSLALTLALSILRRWL